MKHRIIPSDINVIPVALLLQIKIIPTVVQSLAVHHFRADSDMIQEETVCHGIASANGAPADQHAICGPGNRRWIMSIASDLVILANLDQMVMQNQRLFHWIENSIKKFKCFCRLLKQNAFVLLILLFWETVKKI